MFARIVPDVIAAGAPPALGPDDSAADAARLMAERNASAIVVLEAGGRLLGIVTERDLACRVVAHGLDGRAVRLAAVMTRDPDALHPDDSALDALELMQVRGYRHLPVVEGERVVGLVALRDLYAIVKAWLERDMRETEALVFGPTRPPAEPG